MADVIDIIHNLSYQVGDESGLDKAADLLNKQLAVINELSKMVKQLNGGLKTMGTAELDKLVDKFQKVAKAAKDAEKAGEGVTGGGSAGGFGALKGGGPMAIAAELGKKALDKLKEELLKTDMAIAFDKEMTKISDSIHGTTVYADELKAHIKSTKEEISNLIAEFDKLAINLPNTEGNVASLQRAAATARAQIPLNGDNYNHEKTTLAANQLASRKQLEDIDLERKIQAKILYDLQQNTVEDVDPLKGKRDYVTQLQKKINKTERNIEEPHISDKDKAALQRELDTLKEIQKIGKEVDVDKLSPDGNAIYARLKEQIKAKRNDLARQELSGSDGKTKANELLLTGLRYDYDAIIEKYKNKQTEISNADIEFARKHAAANAQEKRKLTYETNADEKKRQEDQLKNLAHFGKETEERIKANNELERQAERAKIAQEEIEFRHAHGESQDVKAAFRAKEAEADQKYADKLEVELKEHSIKVQQEHNKLDEQVQASGAGRTKQLLEDMERQGKYSEDLALQQIEQERKLATEAAEHKYEDNTRNDQELVNQLKDTKGKETQEYQDANNRIIQLTKILNNDLDNINEQHNKKEVDTINASHQKQQDKIAKKYARQLSAAQAAGRVSPMQKLHMQLDEANGHVTEAQANVTDLETKKDNNGNRLATNEEIEDAKKKLNDARIAAKEAQKEIREAMIANVNKVFDGVTQAVQAVANALNQIYAQQEKMAAAQAQAQQTRVDYLVKTADRGNAELLRQEQERLDAIQRRRELIAKRQMEVNKLVQVSETAKSLAEAIGAVVAAASDGDPYTIAFRIIAAVGALVAGVATVKSAFSQDSFADGVVDYKGKGSTTSDSNLVRISRGESVITAAATQKYAPMLMAMNKGLPIPMPLVQMHNTDGYASKKELTTLNHKMDALIAATEGNSVRVNQNIDRHGVHQMVETARHIERRRWT